MDYRLLKLYNEEEFDRITRGIKVAECMQLRSASNGSEAEKLLNQLEDLAVSDSRTCSFCNTTFEDLVQQRLHYKLDWHRYNLKQRLQGLKSITEDDFSLLADKDSMSSISGTDLESDCESETSAFETGELSNRRLQNESIAGIHPHPARRKMGKQNEKTENSDSSDGDVEDEDTKNKETEMYLSAAKRHLKVFFENDNGNIFSIYRCLLHNKKTIPEVDSEMIAQALNSGKRSMWTVIMLGGGHFAAAVFQGGEVVVHKTFHRYTVRAKQGSAQYSRDTRMMGNMKSPGTILRRYNESMHVQIQEFLESWASHINTSSLILYRAAGPYNRTILFGGRNPPLDRSDSRLRPLPFPTRRATFSEVQRVYDVLTSIEIYGSAVNFKDSFPVSPRQLNAKKALKSNLPVKEEENGTKIANGFLPAEVGSLPCTTEEIKNNSPQNVTRKRHRKLQTRIDRAKPRKSPRRPLPDIVARLAQSSSESELNLNINSMDIELVEEDFQINFEDHLQAFQDSVPRYLKNKKIRRQKKNIRKNRNDGESLKS
ncbi:ankyrin repeat and zinc finger domain-containing protein 1 isoform X2 [Orussus abietinus]|uniref:ankyrin repeat and zinc finger domain-containing protein 1 isoform X2 n=1 Tax=Orussus abietinus TaxID=222816 RepID=UPI000625BE61|nr:ankyrin repeat and zinc finger domain-containing protein 1 isoform X2 [Orussus abietinus]